MCFHFLLQIFFGNFQVYDFLIPPSYQFLHGSHKYHIDIIGHVAAAPGPLAFLGRALRLEQARGPSAAAKTG